MIIRRKIVTLSSFLLIIIIIGNCTLSSSNLIDGTYKLKSSSSSNGYEGGYLSRNDSIQIRTRLNFLTIHFSFLPETIFYGISSFFHVHESTKFLLENVSYPVSSLNRNIFEFHAAKNTLFLLIEAPNHNTSWKYELFKQRQLNNHMCQTYNIFQGKWLISENQLVPSYDQMKQLQCPSFNESENFYSYTQPYHLAVFIPSDDCHVLPLEKSMKFFHLKYQRTIPNIRMVGDSLVFQIKLASDCDLEYLKLPRFPSESYYLSTYLRNDIPCDQRCSELSFYEAHSKQGRGLDGICFGCKFKNTISHTDWKLNQKNFPWIYSNEIITQETDILIVNNGAWMNSFHSIPNGTETSIETIQLILPHFEYLLEKNAKLKIFWLGLPPAVNTVGIPYDYSDFSLRNAKTKEIFHSSKYSLEGRLIFIDVENFARERKMKDTAVANDQTHWKNPGSFSIPSFLWELIMHLYVIS